MLLLIWLHMIKVLTGIAAWGSAMLQVVLPSVPVPETRGLAVTQFRSGFSNARRCQFDDRLLVCLTHSTSYTSAGKTNQITATAKQLPLSGELCFSKASCPSLLHPTLSHLPARLRGLCSLRSLSCRDTQGEVFSRQPLQTAYAQQLAAAAVLNLPVQGAALLRAQLYRAAAHVVPDLVCAPMRELVFQIILISAPTPGCAC